MHEILQYYWYTMEDNNILNNIIQITYFKEFIEILFKYLVYYKISNSQDIFISKNKKADVIPKFNFSFYKELNKIINIINNHINNN